MKKRLKLDLSHPKRAWNIHYFSFTFKFITAILLLLPGSSTSPNIDVYVKLINFVHIFFMLLPNCFSKFIFFGNAYKNSSIWKSSALACKNTKVTINKLHYEPWIVKKMRKFLKTFASNDFSFSFILALIASLL